MAIDPVQIAAHHVQDAAVIVLPFGKEIALPNIFGFQVTKLMAIELLAAVLMLLIFIPLARKIRTGKSPRGRWWNAFEAAVLFIRDGVVRPAIGGRDANRFVPFILTLFFFILFCNLLGLVPWLGSPTGSINVTAVLALVAFAVVVGAGMKKHGPVRFWTGLCPPMDVPKSMAVFLIPMILSIEILGLVIRHTILAVRLLANMFAGHLVVGVIVAFIPVVVHSVLWYGVTPAAVLGATALNLLELFVAFLQAYVFAFLTALFIGMSLHQH
ncbi:MAG: F0F1 ATP synthase subunit A [Thermoguttaceae bacterium]